MNVPSILYKLTTGDTVKFKLKDLTSEVVYSGRVVAIADYSIAHQYGDVGAVQSTVAQADADVADVRNQTYIIVKLDSEERPRPFAFEWIKSIERLEAGKTYTVTLYNVSAAEANAAISILKGYNYSCKLS